LLSGGFEVRREALTNAGLPGGEGHAEHQALYLQHEAGLTKALALTAGLRHDHHSRFGSEWSPRLYAVWQAAPGWTVKGGYGHGFKAPTLKQISPDYREDEGPYTYFGNAALKPEANDALEVGVGWDNAAAGLQLMLFRKPGRQPDRHAAVQRGGPGATSMSSRTPNTPPCRAWKPRPPGARVAS
jgi:outer membrane receptor for ferrienterochelin and colicins